MNLPFLVNAQGGEFIWSQIMFVRSIAVIVRFVDTIRVRRLRRNTGRSIVCWLRQTRGCEGSWQACSRRRSVVAASSSWRGSRECIATPWHWASGNCGKSTAFLVIVCADPALAENAWRKNARGTDGLAGAFAGCHRRRSDHRHEMDASFVAKALQGPASSRSEVVSAHVGAFAATFALLAANVSQGESGNPSSGS